MCCPCCAQILICQNLRNNLQHPNEYIRGSTLRFLCRIREEEILEPLVPSILTNLEHRHSYVRRAAVLAVNSIYKLPKGELLLQDAPETIEKVLRSEQDLSTKRNAFVMLSNHAQDRAAKYLFENIESIATWGDILQMAVLDLIRKASSVQQGLGPAIVVVKGAAMGAGGLGWLVRGKSGAKEGKRRHDLYAGRLVSL